MPRAIRVVRAILRPLFMVLTKRDWRGDELLPGHDGADGGWVLAANHLSKLDPLLLGHWQVDHQITPRYLVKDTLFAVPVIGSLVRSAQQIPVHRDTAVAADSLRSAVRAVQTGDVVTIYPEGTITRDPQLWPMSGRTGAVRVAHATGCPLVPVAQWGPQKILAPYAKLLKVLPRKTYQVRVGAPLDLAWLGADPTRDDFEKATDQLMDAITDLLAQIRDEQPSGPRVDVHTIGPRKTTYHPDGSN